MKICLVSAFPPSRRGLNEYGYHLARELQQNPLLSTTVLSDRLDGEVSELEDFSVVRCWSFNALSNPTQLLKAINDIKPDVVWFNLLFSTFGDKPVQAFLGLMTPLLSRLNGYYTHVTLHHLMDNIDLKDAGIRFPRLYRMAGTIATKMLLMANSVSVLLPAYRRTLIEKYSGKNVHFRAHGILSARPEYPDFSKRGNPEHRIVAFGKWGTYKRLETLIEAFAQVSEAMPNARLVIAGGNHPMTPGYVESVAERYQGSDKIRFTGYVAEEDIPELFSTASVVVMPYHSATGASGVAHIACEYGVPIVSADIPDFREMAADEGLAIDFYEIGVPENLAEKLLMLLNSEEQQREMSEQNFAAAMRMTMPQIIQKYVRSFEFHKWTKDLGPISHFRRLPLWVPSRSMLFRAAAPRWTSWT
jgi:glycosyltransferase involved in cell wall biosynthesis